MSGMHSLPSNESRVDKYRSFFSFMAFTNFSLFGSMQDQLAPKAALS
jgi:hypothetical protein